jgi:hypothetical protein
MNTPSFDISLSMTGHDQVQNNYFWFGTGGDPYGIRTLMATGDNLFQNNIFEKVRIPIMFDGPDSGTVISYNYAVNDYSNEDNLWQAFWEHSAGDDYHLFEGNIAPGISQDIYHGTHLTNTAFRNFNTGWESCANGQCGAFTSKDSGVSAMLIGAYNRYFNMIGNVLGTPGYHSTYQLLNGSSSFGSQYIYEIGFGDGGVPAADPTTLTTSMRWANWDTVTGAAHFCGSSSNTGWSTICGSTSEIPFNAPSFPNSVPTVGDTGAGQPSLPPSFYLTTKPSWFGSLPFPLIGPDVTGGNVGQCAGPLNTPGKFNGLPAANSSQCAGSSLTTPAWGGHVNTNPAMRCYLNVMLGPPDGTGSVLPFNASACYGSTGGSTGGPSPPTGLAGSGN